MRIRFLYPQQDVIQTVDIPNFEYLPLFYLFPKELLKSECPALVDMPRSVHGIFTQEKWFRQLASDFFMQAVIDLTAFFVWPAFGISTYMECFSGYDPLWQLAHAIPIWRNAYTHMSGITPKSLADTPEREQPWIGLDEFQNVMLQIGLHGITENNLLPCIEAVREMRCAEDYDNRNSNAKIDFYRGWYHTRSKTTSVSLDNLIEMDSNDSRDDSISAQLGNYVSDPTAQYEDVVCSKLDIEKFYQSIKPLDREILELRIQGYTYQEIADKIKYKTHSAVLKRINRIAERYFDFTDEQEGLREYLIG
jgi:hypothetical protein